LYLLLLLYPEFGHLRHREGVVEARHNALCVGKGTFRLLCVDRAFEVSVRLLHSLQVEVGGCLPVEVVAHNATPSASNYILKGVVLCVNPVQHSRAIRLPVVLAEDMRNRQLVVVSELVSHKVGEVRFKRGFEIVPSNAVVLLDIHDKATLLGRGSVCPNHSVRGLFERGRGKPRAIHNITGGLIVGFLRVCVHRLKGGLEGLDLVHHCGKRRHRIRRMRHSCLVILPIRFYGVQLFYPSAYSGSLYGFL